MQFKSIKITINVVANVKMQRKVECEKDYIWNPPPCICENSEYVGSIAIDLMIMCDESLGYNISYKTLIGGKTFTY